MFVVPTYQIINFFYNAACNMQGIVQFSGRHNTMEKILFGKEVNFFRQSDFQAVNKIVFKDLQQTAFFSFI